MDAAGPTNENGLNREILGNACEHMRFSIVTPSYRNSAWLSLCVASVADQGVELEHIVQDAGSDDGTLDWLARDPRVRAFVEKDSGMYDAINRGLRRARGDVLAYLNCDEQYLPGALAAAGRFFDANPLVEVLMAGAIVIDEEGRYRCHRLPLAPVRHHSLVSGNLSFLTCATFFRSSIIRRHGLFFDETFRVAGDAAWIVRLIDAGVRMAALPVLTSAFTDAGGNLGLGPGAASEAARLRATAPAWARTAPWLSVAHHRFRRLLAGHYRRLAPFSYSIYCRNKPDSRSLFHVEKPTFRWIRKPSRP